jgi:phosphoglycolate phosphatase-like HAD superfamily hydrolase
MAVLPGVRADHGPVVGFDLDLTLVDSAAGIGATVRAAFAAEGYPERPSDDELRPLIGTPLEAMLAEVAPRTDPERVARRYRELYPAVGVPGTTLLPGVREAFAAVHAQGGRVLVVSAKVEPAVRAVLEHVGLGTPLLAPDVVVGGLFGAAKGVRLRAAGAHVYVGDHPADMQAARAAGAVGVGVTTGASSPQALRAAGADIVLPGVIAFAAWFDGWYATWKARDRPGRSAREAAVSAASGPGLDDEAREGDGEADRAEQGQRREGAGS